MKKILIVLLSLAFVSHTVSAYAALTQTEVSQLYIAVFGRASEGGGNSYWQNDPQSTNMTVTANVMLNTQPAKDYFGSTLDDNQAFIEHIYLNTLGKSYTEDPEGIDYWVSELDRGKAKGEVISALIVAAQHPANAGAAQDRFNKVEVSNYCADTIFEYTDLATFTGFLSSVTDAATSVTSAKEAVETVFASSHTGDLLYGVEYNGSLYKVVRNSSVESTKSILDNPGQWIDKVSIIKNGAETAITYDESIAVLESIVNLHWPPSIATGAYWDSDLGIWRADCWDVKSVACSQATLGFDSNERKNVYKKLITQIITGYPNPASRKTSQVANDTTGETSIVDTMPRGYKTVMEDLQEFADVGHDDLGLINGMIGVSAKAGSFSLKSLSDAQKEIFTNMMQVIDGAMIVGQVGISYTKRLAIHEYMATYGNSLQIIDELKKAHNYVKNNEKAELDPSLLVALNELEEEILASAKTMSVDYITPLVGAIDDELESIVALGADIAMGSTVAKLYVKHLETVYKSSSGRITASLGSAINLLTNAIFIARDAERAWENIFLSAHIQHVLSLYWGGVRKGLTPIVRDQNENSYYVYNEDKITQREVIISLLESSSILYYDTIIDLVDPNWANAMIDVASSAISGISTGTALTPLPYFGSALTVGQALGKSASCGDSLIFGDNDAACKSAGNELRAIRTDLSGYYSAMDTWRELIGANILEQASLNSCDSANLDLCETSSTCSSAGGYWLSDNTCNEGQETLNTDLIVGAVFFIIEKYNNGSFGQTNEKFMIKYELKRVSISGTSLLLTCSFKYFHTAGYDVSGKITEFMLKDAAGIILAKYGDDNSSTSLIDFKAASGQERTSSVSFNVTVDSLEEANEIVQFDWRGRFWVPTTSNTCDIDHLSLCKTLDACFGAGGSSWKYDPVLDVSECGISKPITCDSSHLNYCSNSAICYSAQGYWYNGKCNSAPQQASCDSNHFNLCATSSTCSNAGGYWYNNECNTNASIPLFSPRFTVRKPYGAADLFINTIERVEVNLEYYNADGQTVVVRYGDFDEYNIFIGDWMQKMAGPLYGTGTTTISFPIFVDKKTRPKIWAYWSGGSSTLSYPLSYKDLKTFCLYQDIYTPLFCGNDSRNWLND